MRLIDADSIVLDYSGLAKISPYDFQGIAEYFLQQIRRLPTVDAVLVTRCKDCVLSEKIENDRTLCRLIDMKVDGNGYCECGQKNVN